MNRIGLNLGVLCISLFVSNAYAVLITDANGLGGFVQIISDSRGILLIFTRELSLVAPLVVNAGETVCVIWPDDLFKPGRFMFMSGHVVDAT